MQSLNPRPPLLYPLALSHYALINVEQIPGALEQNKEAKTKTEQSKKFNIKKKSKLSTKTQTAQSKVDKRIQTSNQMTPCCRFQFRTEDL